MFNFGSETNQLTEIILCIKNNLGQIACELIMVQSHRLYLVSILAYSAECLFIPRVKTEDDNICSDSKIGQQTIT